MKSFQLFFMITMLLFFAFTARAADEPRPEVQVADPFLELHTGPGIGFPVFYVVERDEWVTILRRRTEWFEIVTRTGKQGWVVREQLEKTLTHAGERKRIPDVTIGDFSRRRWELGLMGGSLDGARLITVYTGYAFTANLLGETSLSQGIGNFSTTWMINGNMVGQPFPEWRISPFFTVGIGAIRTDPKVTLVQSQDRTDTITHVGVGVRSYVTRRFVFRAEYRSFVISTSDDDNEDPEAWQLGFAVFF